MKTKFVIQYRPEWEITTAATTLMDGYVKLGEFEAEHKDPKGTVNEQVEILKEEKKKLQAKCQVRLDDIDTVIQNLLAIESK